MFLPKPRGFRSPELVAERLEMLDREPAGPLLRWAEGLAARRGVTVPLFDPAEAGVAARVLIVHEAPGPMTNADNARPGSGFISVDNDDQSAETMWRLREQVGLSQHLALHWNIVPWYLGAASIKPTAQELGQGAMELRRLLALLPDLQVVVTSGRFAQTGWTKHIAPFRSDLVVIPTWHPSPLAMNQPGKRDELRRALERAVGLVTSFRY